MTIKNSTKKALLEVGEKDRLKLESNEASKKNFIQRLFNS